jgi:glycosyltransferase involved in cell wall biosynthesis
LRLAFVDIGNPEEVTTWSGTPFSILQEIRRQGVEVEVIAPLARPFKYLFAPQKLFAKLAGRNIQVNRRPLALQSFAAQIEKRIERGRFDAIFSTSSIPVTRISAGIPVLFWVDAVTEAMVNYYAGAFANIDSRELRIAHAQEQAALDRASFAVYSSEWAANVVKQNYVISDDRLKVIEYGANLPISHDLDQISAFNEQRLKSKCVLLFIGVDWDRKGGPLAFEATRLLNERGIEAILKVVGSKAPEAPFVENLGFINKNTHEGEERIKYLLATSTFLLLPTRAEAAGIVFCEASAFGLPTVSTRTGGVENYVIDSQSGYCLPLEASASDYADAIYRTLKNPKTYSQLSMGAFQKYQQTLNWSVGVSAMLKLVEQVRRTN